MHVRHLMLWGMPLGGILAPALHAQHIPGVDVWLATPADSIAPGERVAAYAVADPGAYMVVFRVTAGNHISVLLPRTPDGGYRVPSQGLHAKGVDVSFQGSASDSTGHLFAAASYTPFDFSRARANGTWDTTRLGAPTTLTPVDAADWFLHRIVPSRHTAYSVNDVAYYVGVSPPPTVVRGGSQEDTGNTMGAAQSQSTVVYVVPGNDGVLYETVDPWYGAGYYTGYYWYDPYTYDVHNRYRRRCPDGSVVPRNAPCLSGSVIGIPVPSRPPTGGRPPVPHRPYPLRTLPSQLRGHIFPAPLRHPPQSGTTIIIPPTPIRPLQQGSRPEVQGGYRTAPRAVPVPPVVHAAPPARPAPLVIHPQAPPVAHPPPPPPPPPSHQPTQLTVAPSPPQSPPPAKTR